MNPIQTLYKGCKKQSQLADIVKSLLLLVPVDKKMIKMINIYVAGCFVHFGSNSNLEYFPCGLFACEGLDGG